MNVEELKIEMIRKRKSVLDMATLLGLSKKTFYSRMSGETSFKQNEIRAIATVLELTPEKILLIFLMRWFPKGNFSNDN